MSAAEIARSAMEIAASMCIYTNDHILLFTLDDEPGQDGANSAAVVAGAGQS
jgi:hypothetical protein